MPGVNSLKYLKHTLEQLQENGTTKIMTCFDMDYLKNPHVCEGYVKKFIRYKEGAEKYSLGMTKFRALAKEAQAVYKVDGIALVNCEIFEKYLETFREC